MRREDVELLSHLEEDGLEEWETLLGVCRLTATFVDLLLPLAASTSCAMFALS